MTSNKIHFFDFVKNLDLQAENGLEKNIILIEKKSLAFYFHEFCIEKPQFFFRELIQEYSNRKIRLIVIYEFQWIQNQQIIQSRIESMFDKSLTIHGRKTKFVRIDKAQSEIFLNENHLQGYVSSKFKYGLFLKTELVAVATFSAGRKMNEQPEDYRSFELIRFANKLGFRVVGGLTKLLMGFTKMHNPGDIMTYVDSAWSDGTGFEAIGFEIKGELKPQEIFANQDKSIPIIWNAGSLKMVLKTHQSFENE
ncbi:MAG: hypothetical protein V4683_04700 [Bacteroidota bacterium]